MSAVMKVFSDTGPVMPQRALASNPMCGDMKRQQERRRRYRESQLRGAQKQGHFMPFRPNEGAAEPIIDEGVTLSGLGADDCRWPLGKDADGEHRFCGCRIHPQLLRFAPMYCEAHARRAVARATMAEEDAQFMAEAMACA